MYQTDVQYIIFKKNNYKLWFYTNLFCFAPTIIINTIINMQNKLISNVLYAIITRCIKSAYTINLYTKQNVKAMLFVCKIIVIRTGLSSWVNLCIN